MDSATGTWINVTTSHTRSDLINLPGTVVLSYDVTGPADLVSSTGVSVYITDEGDNGTDHAASVITCVDSGNAKKGVCDLDDDSQELVSRDITLLPTWGDSSTAGTSKVVVAVKLTHAAGNDMASDADYAIAADFCYFDQNNGSDTHLSLIHI